MFCGQQTYFIAIIFINTILCRTHQATYPTTPARTSNKEIPLEAVSSKESSLLVSSKHLLQG